MLKADFYNGALQDKSTSLVQMETVFLQMERVL